LVLQIEDDEGEPVSGDGHADREFHRVVNQSLKPAPGFFGGIVVYWKKGTGRSRVSISIMTLQAKTSAPWGKSGPRNNMLSIQLVQV
jgi:hypothetical protein